MIPSKLLSRNYPSDGITDIHWQVVRTSFSFISRDGGNYWFCERRRCRPGPSFLPSSSFLPLLSFLHACLPSFLSPRRARFAKRKLRDVYEQRSPARSFSTESFERASANRGRISRRRHFNAHSNRRLFITIAQPSRYGYRVGENHHGRRSPTPP